jgi:hypothetical protein
MSKERIDDSGHPEDPGKCASGEVDIDAIMDLPGHSQVALIRELLAIADGERTDSEPDVPLDLFSEPGVLTPTPTVVYRSQPTGIGQPLEYAYTDGRETPRNGYVNVAVDPSELTPTPRIFYGGSKAYMRYPFEGEVFSPGGSADLSTAILLSTCDPDNFAVCDSDTPAQFLPPVRPVSAHSILTIDFSDAFKGMPEASEKKIPGTIPEIQIDFDDFASPDSAASNLSG